MSYDFTILRVAPGADPEQVASMDAPYGDEPDSRPLVAWDGALRERIVGELRRLNPALEVEGRELNDEKTGVQVTFFDREASLMVPYWHKGPDGERVFKEIWGTLRVFDAAGAAVYDPQVGRVLRLESDLPMVLRTYGVGTGALAGGARRAWWKFW